MGAINSTISLFDNFTTPMMNVIQAANAGIATMQNVQAAMSSSIDTTSWDMTRTEIDSVIEAANALESALNNIDSPVISATMQSNIGKSDIVLPNDVTIPVTPYITEQVEISVPDELKVPVVPYVAEEVQIEVPDNLEVPVTPVVEQQLTFDTPDKVEISVETVIADSEQQIAEITSQLNNVVQMQEAITAIAKSVYVIPDDTTQDIVGVSREIAQMQRALEFIKTNPFNLDSSIAKLQIQSLSDGLNEVIAKQQQVDNFMGGAASQAVDLTVKPVVPDPLVEQPNPVEIPVTWKTDSMEVFTNTGIERFQQEIQSTNSMLDNLIHAQTEITSQAENMEILPTTAVADIQALHSRIQGLQSSILEVEQNKLDIGSDEANAQLERLRSQLNQIMTLENNLKSEMSDMGVEQINNAYLQISQTVSNVERTVRDSFSEPVEIPVTWKTDNLEVFTNTGIERFQQEIQSANNMLSNLNHTQSQIAATAAQTNLFPANAVASMNSMQTRLQAIQQRIQQIESNSLNIGADEANAQLEQLRSQLSQALQQQETLNNAVEQMDVSAANDAYLRLSQTIGGAERYIRDNTSEQNQFNRSIEQGVQGANDLIDKIKGVAAAYLSIRGVTSLLSNVGVTDMSGAFDRLDTMNQFDRTVTIMTGSSDAASAALDRLNASVTGTAYGLDVASKATQGFLTRGMDLDAATEQVRIWADAVSFYGEGTNEQLESVVDAIGKMYSKGTVEADQLDRLFDAGIGAAEIYADAVGMSVTQVKDDLSDGTIAATQFIDTVSQALDSGMSEGAAQAAGATWATTFANLQAAVTRGWADIITNLDAELAARGLPSTMEMVTTFGQKVESVLKAVGGAMGPVISGALGIYNVVAGMVTNVGSFVQENWGTIISVVQGVVNGVTCLLTVMSSVLDVALNVAQGIIDNWSIIAPIVMGVVTALLLYKAVSIAVAVINGIMAASQAVHSAATAMATGTTFAETAAQYGLNAALAACPITWIVVAIIGLIAVIYAVCAAIAKFTGAASSGFGIICGAINVTIQFFKNLGLEVANISLGISCAILAVCENMKTAFHNAICNVQAWFYDLLSTALSVIGSIAAELNKLPFVEFDYSGITNAADKYAAKAAEAAGNKEDYTSISDAFHAGMSTFDTFQDGWAADAFDAGADWGDGISDKISGFLDGFGQDSTTEELIPQEDDYYDNSGNNGNNYSAIDNIGDGVGSIADNTASIADDMEITEEDLKYLRDIAEQETINRFTTAEITIEQTNHNNVAEKMDLDGIVDGLTDAVNEAVEIITEGVHA